MKRHHVALLGAAMLLAALSSSANGGTKTSDMLSCPGATGGMKATRIDGSWRRDLPKAAWVKAGLTALDWETNGGRHTLTFDHGVFLDHDVVVGNPPDACGPFSLKGAVLTAHQAAVGGALQEKVLLFKVKATRNGDTLRLAPLKALDPVARYVFSGTWRKLG
jgi:hypothetical protein